jgi:hypothetical protein
MLNTITTQNLRINGIDSFGHTLPKLHAKWLTGTPSDVLLPNELGLDSGAERWKMPINGLVNAVQTGKGAGFPLQKANGEFFSSAGLLLRLFPQQILRIRHLVGLKLENHPDAEGPKSSMRPMPAFFFFETDADLSTFDKYQQFPVGSDLGFSGKLFIFDEKGYLLHPHYVAALFQRIQKLYPVVNADPAPEDDDWNWIFSDSDDDVRYVRLVQADGSPFVDIDRLTGLQAEDATIGLFKTPDAGNAMTIGKASAGDAYSEDAQNSLLLGNLVQGALAPSLALPEQILIDEEVALKFDYYILRVADFQQELMGTPNEGYPGHKFEIKPVVRMHQSLELLGDGNGIMGRIGASMASEAQDKRLVAPDIDTKLALPENVGVNRFPQFPSIADLTTGDTPDWQYEALRTSLENQSTAKFVAVASGQPTDVELTLKGLPIGTAVRVFNRVFGSDAELTRGDGAGGICREPISPAPTSGFTGQLKIKLKDPLKLKNEVSTTVPSNPLLIFDLVLHSHNREAYLMIGGLELAIASAEGAVPGDNRLENALAPDSVKKTTAKSFLTFEDKSLPESGSTWEYLKGALVDQQGATDSPRLPTMLRRDMLMAAGSNVMDAGIVARRAWQTLLACGNIDNSLHHAEAKVGAPGSPGGKERLTVGVFARDNILAYDMARATFRRTTNFYTRLTELKQDAWNEPPQPDYALEVSEGSTLNGAAVLLQNIAPFCETPELGFLKAAIENDLNQDPPRIPDNFNMLVDRVVEWLNGLDIGDVPYGDEVRESIVEDLENLKDESLAENKQERLFNEIKRELGTSCFGRRDSQWALKNAIENARSFIYIETNSFGMTGAGSDPQTVDLLAVLKTRLAENPALKVVISVSVEPDYTKKFKHWTKAELKKRYEVLTEDETLKKRVVVFHPMGFPGRALSLQHHLVVVDDRWALIGSSSFMRRGLTFDGSSDVVFAPYDLVMGGTKSLKKFRLHLIRQHLGIQENTRTSQLLMTMDDLALVDLIKENLNAGGHGQIAKLKRYKAEGLPSDASKIAQSLINPEGIGFQATHAQLATLMTLLST